MYTDFYHFRKIPFSPKPDAEFLYLSDNHETGLAVLANGLANGVAVNVVLGNSGTGKTLLIQYLLKHIQQDCPVCLVDKSIHSELELLKSILTGFGRSIKEANKKNLYRRLVGFLAAQSKQQNQPALLVIDDAHTLPADALMMLSKLSALSVDEGKLFQLVLVGQHELLTRLNAAELEGFAERIGTLCYLEPLSIEDTGNYIRYRLKVAGGDSEMLFDEQACSAIYDYSQGNPESINFLCDDTLVYGSALHKTGIDADLVRHAANGSVQENFERPSNGIGTLASTDILVPWFSRFDRFLKSAVVTAGILIGVLLTISLVADLELLSRSRPANLLSLGLLSQPHQNDAMETSGVTQNQLSPTDEDRIVRTSARSVKVNSVLKNPTGISSEDNADRIRAHRLAKAKHFGPTTKGNGALPKHNAARISESTKHRQLEKLFARAEKKIATANLVFPQNDSAFSIYIHILAISPSNQRALSGLDKIAGHYLRWAQDRRAEGKLKRSQLFVTRGLKVRPENRDLVALENQVAAELLERESRANTIETLAERAGQQVALLRLTLPEGENAYETYQEMFAIDKFNQQAAEGLQEIPVQLKSLLISALRKKDFASALAFAEQAINMDPGGVDNRNGEALVATAIEAKKTIRSRIETLLDRAESYVSAQKLVLPPDENAFQYYQDVLAIDPENRVAQAGLGRIEKQYQTLARSKLQEGNREQSLMLVEEGLKVFPDNASLRGLLDQIGRKPDLATKETMVEDSEGYSPDDVDTKKRVRSFVTF